MERYIAVQGVPVLGPGSNQPRRDERMLAATLVALYPLVLHGRSATDQDVDDWDGLRARYLGVDRRRKSRPTGQQ